MTATLAASANADLLLTGAPEGLDALVLANLAREAGGSGAILHVARDDRRLEALQAGLAFFGPDVRVIPFPAWDTVPYDRAAPNADIVAKRITALAKLAIGGGKGPAIVLATVNALLQRVPPRSFVRGALRPLAAGQRVDRESLIQYLTRAGFSRVSAVMEAGEYAVRGGIIDVFPPGRTNPARLDFFGDTLESIRAFDAQTQRTTKPLQKLALLPISEAASGEAAIRLFRARYVELFGGATGDDPLYEAVSAGRRYPGQEHWLPLFHEHLETLLDYLPGAPVSFDSQAGEAIHGRWEEVAEHYQARVEGLEAKRFGAPPYKPVPPDRLYLDGAAWAAALAGREIRRLTPFEDPSDANARACHGRVGRTFAAERANPDANVFDAVVAHIRRLQGDNRRVLIAAWTPGARERLATLLADHGLKDTRKVETFAEALALPGAVAALAVLGLEQGFETPELAVIGEQDILGDRLARPRRKTRRALDVLIEATSLAAGDLVVHAEYGIARFAGLVTIAPLGAPHDCVELHYADGAKLFLPVENIELLTRYGSEDAAVPLDRLGGVAWQSRKARLKQRLREIAAELIRVAARRQLQEAPALAPPAGLYDEFAARFPYEETEDQEASIAAVLADLNSGRPMDRLVCGDVGFGKTEVALRAAFIAVTGGRQVAFLAPTTLLAEQHYQTLVDRFSKWPVKVAEVSRFRSGKEITASIKGIADGSVDIVVGTHKLLSESTKFKNLGLLIIDEEHRFGVRHKEAMKALRAEVDVLTLTATPIPRTLGMALEGIRDLSVIATAPQRRLAIKTFVRDEGNGVIREAVLRELKRGGQVYFLHNEVETIENRRARLEEILPEAHIAVAHGQMPERELERVMRDFVAQRYNLLLCSTIIETGIDVPSANTIVISRADKFGLAQLHQLRGRVGRSHHQAYAYLMVPDKESLTKQAQQRLDAIQQMEELGSGFYLAMHDLEIRGAGEVLGENQSGNMLEIGFQLYNEMLNEAVASLKAGREPDLLSPLSVVTDINLHAPALLPDDYCGDVHLRLSFYKKLATARNTDQIDALLEEIVDRFGKLPVQAQTLIDVHRLRVIAKPYGVVKVDAAPGVIHISFRKDAPVDPMRIIDLIQKNRHIKLVGNEKLRIERALTNPKDRAQMVRDVLRSLGQPLQDSPRSDLRPPPPTGGQRSGPAEPVPRVLESVRGKMPP